MWASHPLRVAAGSVGMSAECSMAECRRSATGRSDVPRKLVDRAYAGETSRVVGLVLRLKYRVCTCHAIREERMSKSSTVTVRETPVEKVATATAGGLVIHGETFVIDDRRAHRAGRSDRTRSWSSSAQFNIQRGASITPLVDAHDVRAVHQRVPDARSSSTSRSFLEADGGARSLVTCTTIRTTPIATA